MEAIVLKEMRKKLDSFQTLSKRQQDSFNLNTIQLKNQMESLDQEISSLLDKISTANDTVMAYINRRVSELDAQKKELSMQIIQLESQKQDHLDVISDYMDHWEELSMADKLTVVDSLIVSVHASEEKIEIKWKI